MAGLNTVDDLADVAATVADIGEELVESLQRRLAESEATRLAVVEEIRDYLEGPYTPTKEAIRALLDPAPEVVARYARELERGR